MFPFGAISSIMYTCSLSLHFILFVRYRWLPSNLKSVHPLMHVACICIPAAAAALGWFLTLYNPTAYAYYLQSYPMDCDTSDGISCIRGKNIKMYMIFMLEVPIFLVFFCHRNGHDSDLQQRLRARPTDIEISHLRRGQGHHVASNLSHGMSICGGIWCRFCPLGRDCPNIDRGGTPSGICVHLNQRSPFAIARVSQRLCVLAGLSKQTRDNY